VAGRIVCAAGESKARAICLGLADALGIHVISGPNDRGQNTSMIGGHCGH
jgi:hypothetical protein